MRAKVGDVELTGDPLELVAVIKALGLLPERAQRKPRQKKRRTPSAPRYSLPQPYTPPKPTPEEFQQQVNLLTPLQRQTFNAVEEIGLAHYSDVAARVGAKPGTVNSRLVELRRKGLLRRGPVDGHGMGTGIYYSTRPTEDGDEAVA